MKLKVHVPTARSSLVAVIVVSVVLVRYVGAPLLPVTVGSALAYAWLLWRSAVQR
jgi:hypothetical protein